MEKENEKCIFLRYSSGVRFGGSEFGGSEFDGLDEFDDIF